MNGIDIWCYKREGQGEKLNYKLWEFGIEGKEKNQQQKEDNGIQLEQEQEQG